MQPAVTCIVYDYDYEGKQTRVRSVKQPRDHTRNGMVRTGQTPAKPHISSSSCTTLTSPANTESTSHSHRLSICLSLERSSPVFWVSDCTKQPRHVAEQRCESARPKTNTPIYRQAHDSLLRRRYATHLFFVHALMIRI